MTLTRRELIRAGAALAAGTLVGGGCNDDAAAPTLPLQRPDLLVILTDQERYPVHWPPGLRERLMPSWGRLAAHGLTYERAYTAASQCSPSRACLWTGEHSERNGVPFLDDGQVLPPQQQLPNIATVMRQAGYDVVYKGKWHLSFPESFGGGSPASETWTAADVAALRDDYGLAEWNPPDAGNNAFDSDGARLTWGGGTANNDGRIVAGVTEPDQTPGEGESALQYLARVGATPRGQRRPFCLIVSLVNPHDIAFYPTGYDQAGYRLEDFEGLGVAVPPNLDDSLATKPSIQARYRDAAKGERALDTPVEQSRYVNFYAYLHAVVEPHIAQLLDALDAQGLTDETVIVRTADHGELGLSHGLTEKAYTAYEEMIHVPLVLSNPRLFAAAQKTDAFWSHIDLLATLAALAGTEAPGVGVSQLPVLANPAAAVRQDVLFTYDDNFILKSDAAGAHIRALRDARHTYAVYFSADGTGFEFELYDNREDPGQLVNLLHEPQAARLPLWRELHRRLSAAMTAEAAVPDNFPWPDDPTRV